MSDNKATTYPYPELTPLPSSNSPPTREIITKWKVELIQNAASVPSNRGGGNHGHTGIVMTVAAYLALTTQQFILPVNPGVQAPYPNNATGPQMSGLDRQHDRAEKEWITYNSLHSNLRAQIIAAVPDKYICTLKDEVMGYANVTVRTLLAHLEATYGTVTLHQLKENEEKMQAPWDINNKPIEDIFDQLEAGRRFAAPHEPITVGRTLRMAIDIIEATGKFELGIRDWEKKDAADQTWANFKVHFTGENTKRLEKETSQSAGYAGAATEPPKKKGKIPSYDADIFTLTELKYCWSHGFNPSHRGHKCKNKQDGHRDEATVDNMMGGINTINRQRNEKPIAKPKKRFNNNRNRGDQPQENSDPSRQQPQANSGEQPQANSDPNAQRQ